MGVLNWLRTITLSGRIEVEVGSARHWTNRVSVQRMQRKLEGQVAYRFSVARSLLPLAYRQMELLITGEQVDELLSSLSRPRRGWRGVQHRRFVSDKVLTVQRVAEGGEVSFAFGIEAGNLNYVDASLPSSKVEPIIRALRADRQTPGGSR